MKYLNILILLSILTTGCSFRQVKENPIVKTEYVEVFIPVVYKLERPKRPIKGKNQSVPSYLMEITSHTNLLEVIIDEHNSKSTESISKNK